MAKTKNNKQWLHRHRNDPYVKSAQANGYRSRAAFKLIEINNRDRILLQGSAVVEFGAAPGGWSQVVLERIGSSGRLLMIDLLPMQSLSGAHFIQGDFAEDTTLSQVQTWLRATLADVVLSDMSPNLCGIKSNDQARSLALAELAFDRALHLLRPGGCFLVKVFQGPEVSDLAKKFAKSFHEVMVRKPAASRTNSGEIYLLAKQFVPERIATDGR